MGTPSRDLMEQFLPKRLERSVAPLFLRIGSDRCLGRASLELSLEDDGMGSGRGGV